jgi:hypothetical protein
MKQISDVKENRTRRLKIYFQKPAVERGGGGRSEASPLALEYINGIFVAVQKTADLFLDGQNQFLTKEIWVRPMSISATSTNSQSVSCIGRYIPSKPV